MVLHGNCQLIQALQRRSLPAVDAHAKKGTPVRTADHCREARCLEVGRLIRDVHRVCDEQRLDQLNEDLRRAVRIAANGELLL